MTTTNSLGWVVQQYIRENGWVAVTDAYPSQEEAEAVRDVLPTTQSLRVYESLDHPNSKRNS